MNELPLTPWQRASALAARQSGLLTTAQARACGLSQGQLHRSSARGWTTLARGLHALPGSVPSRRRDVQTSVLLAGPDALASHVTAAGLWAWCSLPPLPHVLVPRTHSYRSPLAKVHRSEVGPLDRSSVEGIPCTSPSRTLVDCAAYVEQARLELFVDDALCSGAASIRSVERSAGRAGRGFHGKANLVAALEAWSDGIRAGSPAEMRMIRRLVDLGAHDVVRQHEVRTDGGRFVARLDAAIPAWRHGFEYDSDHHHNPRRWSHDEARYAALRALGWRVTPVAKVDLLPSSTWLADALAAARPAA